MQERASPSVVDTEPVILIVDPETLAIVNASHGARRALGFDVDGRDDSSLRDIVVHPPGDELDRHIAAACAEGGVDVTLGALLGISSGRTAPVELTLSALESRERRLLAVTFQSTGRLGDVPSAARLDAGNAVFAEFVGRLGHDVNNLLSTIIGSLGLLREDDAASDSDERRQLVDDALSASRECADLLERILAAAGKQIVRPQRMDVNDVVRRITPLLKSILPGNIELEESLEPGLPQVELDPDRLEAAIICLVANAREAMSKGGRLSISSSIDEHSTPPAVRVSVSDEGPGIPENLHARILEPLFSTKPSGTGRGLGLNIVSAFVQRSNGVMDIDSTQHRGTRVTLSFPAAE